MSRAHFVLLVLLLITLLLAIGFSLAVWLWRSAVAPEVTLRAPSQLANVPAGVTTGTIKLGDLRTSFSTPRECSITMADERYGTAFVAENQLRVDLWQPTSPDTVMTIVATPAQVVGWQEQMASTTTRVRLANVLLDNWLSIVVGYECRQWPLVDASVFAADNKPNEEL